MKWAMKAPWLALTVLVSLPFLFGCEADDSERVLVTYRNETEVGLFFSVEEEEKGGILPARSELAPYDYNIKMDDPFRLQVWDRSGCVVYSLDTTPRELQSEYDLTITILEEDVEHCAP